MFTMGVSGLGGLGQAALRPRPQMMQPMAGVAPSPMPPTPMPQQQSFPQQQSLAPNPMLRSTPDQIANAQALIAAKASGTMPVHTQIGMESDGQRLGGYQANRDYMARVIQNRARPNPLQTPPIMAPGQMPTTQFPPTV